MNLVTPTTPNFVAVIPDAVLAGIATATAATAAKARTLRMQRPPCPPIDTLLRASLFRQTVLARPQGGLRSVADPDPLEHAGQVRLHGLLGDLEAAGDELVREALRD